MPGRGKGRIFRVFDQLEQMETSGTTDLRETFKQFASRSRQQGLAVVISDFLDPQGFEHGLKILASMGHDVFVVHIASMLDRIRARSARCGSSTPRRASSAMWK